MLYQTKNTGCRMSRYAHLTNLPPEVQHLYYHPHMPHCNLCACSPKLVKGNFALSFTDNPEMRINSWLLLTLVHAIICHAAAVIPGPASTLSALPNLPDHRFKVGVRHFAPAIPEPSCRMALNAAMRDLALMDFEGHLSEPGAKAYVHPRYPGAIILISAGLGIPQVSIRFAIWTLYEAIRDTLRGGKGRKPICTRTYYVGLWEGREIVHVRILQQPPTAAPQLQTINTPGAQTAAAKDALASEGANGSFSFKSKTLSISEKLGAGELHADVTYRPKEMDRRDIYMAIFGVMLRLAPTNRGELGIFHDNAIGITHEVICIFNRAAKSIPYALTTGDLISLVAYMPEHLLTVGKWQDMDITITDNEFPNVVIARGSFRLGKPARPPIDSLIEVS